MGTTVGAGGSGTAQVTHAYADPGTFNLTLTVTDNDGDAGSQTVSVEVLSPADAGAALIELVDGLDIPEGTKSSLNAKLEGATKAFENGKVGPGVKKLNKLIDLVNAQRGTEISDEDADALIAQVQAIIASVEGDPGGGKPGKGKAKSAGLARMGNSGTVVEFGLEQNTPNPFNPITAIQYSLAEASRVRLTIYNVLGQEVRVLVDENQSPGVYNLQWDGRDASGRNVSTGLYLYRLEAGSNIAVRKMIFVK